MLHDITTHDNISHASSLCYMQTKRDKILEAVATQRFINSQFAYIEG